MKTIKGDLIQLALAGQFDVIIHGCNCFHTMGAGIAKSIKSVFPEAYEADLTSVKGDSNKLGSFTTATVVRNGYTITIINLYSQYDWRGYGCKVDYGAIQTGFKAIKNQYPDKRIGYPMIGAGLAGGDWNVISAIINKELVDIDHTLVKFK